MSRRYRMSEDRDERRSTGGNRPPARNRYGMPLRRVIALLFAVVLSVGAILGIGTHLLTAGATDTENPEPTTDMCVALSAPSVTFSPTGGTSVRLSICLNITNRSNKAIPEDTTITIALADAEGNVIVPLEIRTYAEIPVAGTEERTTRATITRGSYDATKMLVIPEQSESIEVLANWFEEASPDIVSEAKRIFAENATLESPTSDEDESAAPAGQIEPTGDGQSSVSGISTILRPMYDGVLFDDETAVLEWRDSEDMERANLTISTPGQIRAWAKRINAYLQGTGLDGYGQLFAETAAEFKVDPRLSPAISRIESGCGAVCVAPHNAWGWGGPDNWASWDSWEEAIRSHVKGLAESGYASMGAEEGTRYCDADYWDGNPEFCLKGEILKI